VIGRDRNDPRDVVTTCDLHDLFDVAEIGRDSLVGLGEADGIRIGVDGDNGESELACVPNRVELRHARSKEEQLSHSSADRMEQCAGHPARRAVLTRNGEAS
jgi:hypothetical protein